MEFTAATDAARTCVTPDSDRHQLGLHDGAARMAPAAGRLKRSARRDAPSSATHCRDPPCNSTMLWRTQAKGPKDQQWRMACHHAASAAMPGESWPWAKWHRG